MEKVGNLRYGQPLSSTVNGKLPENCPRKGMAEAMLHAWKLFGDKNVWMGEIKSNFYISYKGCDCVYESTWAISCLPFWAATIYSS